MKSARQRTVNADVQGKRSLCRDSAISGIIAQDDEPASARDNDQIIFFDERILLHETDSCFA